MALLLLGAGGFAREVGRMILSDSHYEYSTKELFFISDNDEQIGSIPGIGTCIGSIKHFNDYYFYKFQHYLDKRIHSYLTAVGSPSLKKSLSKRAEEVHWVPHNKIISSRAYIGDADIGDGSIICPGCSITTNVTIGKHVNVNLNCTIGHDVIIQNFVNISPHCTISGNVSIGIGADLGSAVTVLPGVTIGENSVIGAGAVVTKDIPENVVAVGVPAKIIKENK